MTGRILSSGSAAGVVFGWSALVPVLVSEGTFRDRCSGEDVEEEGNAVSCDARTTRLATVFIVGNFASLAGPAVTGFVNDWMGPRFTCGFAVMLAWIGWSLNAAAVGGTADSLLIVGFFFLGMSAVTFLFPVLSVSNLFPGSEGLVIACLNGLFDGAAVVFVIFAALHRSAGIDLLHIFLGYMAGPLVISALFGIFLWPPKPFRPLQRVGDRDPETPSTSPTTVMSSPHSCQPPKQRSVVPVRSTVDSEGNVELCHRENLSDNSSPQVTVSAQPGRKHENKFHGEQQSLERTQRLLPPDSDLEGEETKHEAECWSEHQNDEAVATPSNVTSEVASEVESPAVSFGNVYSPFLLLPAKEQLMTKEYLLYLVFQSIHIFRFAWVLAAAPGHLEDLERDDSPSVDDYLSILGIVLPIGALIVIPAGLLMDRWGVEAGLFALSGAGIALSIATLIPVMEAQLLTFCLTGIARSLTFSTMGAYIPARFGIHTMGSLLGVAEGTGGLVVGLQFPALAAALRFGFDYVNAALLVLGVLQLLFPFYLMRKRRSESLRVEPNAP